jgi:hypothetical protein
VQEGGVVGVYSTLLQAVQTSVASVIPNTVLRYKVQKLENDTLPLCIVAPGPGGEQIGEQQFSRNLWFLYPVLVVYIAPENRQTTQGLFEWLDTREAIRNQLNQVLLNGAATVFDTDLAPEEAVRLGEYVGSNYAVTGFLVRYKSAEQRVR